MAGDLSVGRLISGLYDWIVEAKLCTDLSHQKGMEIKVTPNCLANLSLA
jgi:hypothetical protein